MTTEDGDIERRVRALVRIKSIASSPTGYSTGLDTALEVLLVDSTTGEHLSGWVPLPAQNATLEFSAEGITRISATLSVHEIDVLGNLTELVLWDNQTKPREAWSMDLRHAIFAMNVKHAHNFADRYLPWVRAGRLIPIIASSAEHRAPTATEGLNPDGVVFHDAFTEGKPDETRYPNEKMSPAIRSWADSRGIQISDLILRGWDCRVHGRDV